ncbi:MAG TPA: metallophosphatase [Bacteroidales bacterium]|nr:metallophosphatase [Bacteroidales bacterium]
MLTDKKLPNNDNALRLLKIASFVLLLFASTLIYGQSVHLVILHTNDTHSQVEPNDKNLGGYARRIGLIAKIRAEEENVLLLDAGDFSQGTPYYNFYKGRVEVEALNRMKYDAVTLGNHEFDNGMDTLLAVLQNNNVPILSANYNFKNTPLDGRVEPFKVIQKGGLRIGIFGLGVNPKGLVFEPNYKGMIYSDPFTTADSIANILKTKEKCDVIICLSHLGANAGESGPNDFEIARSSQYIDVILGGHSHDLITKTTEKNRRGKPVIIAQMGKSGLFLGRVDLTVEKKRKSWKKRK